MQFENKMSSSITQQNTIQCNADEIVKTSMVLAHVKIQTSKRSGRGVQHYVIKFLSDLRQGDGFLRVLRFPHQ